MTVELHTAMSGPGPTLKKTVTRADLHEAVYQKVGLSRKESAALVNLVLKEVADCLERGELVNLSGFGSFVVHQKGDRVGRNPKTGEEVPILARRVIVFRPSAVLKQRIQPRDAAIDGEVPTPVARR
jgi:integration host factor subunit alpha